MRLLMINNEFPPLGGGTGTVNLAILDRFVSIQDLEVDLVTSTMGRKFEAEAYSENIRVCKLPVFKHNIHHASNVELLMFAVKALPFALKQHRQHPYDLCFAWSAVPAGGVALGLRRLLGLKYLVRVSGPDIPGFERRYQWLYPILTPIIRSIWLGAEAVVAKCQEESTWIREIDKKVKVTIIPNGVDAELFKPIGTKPLEGPLRILCVARLIRRKGQKYLIEAVKRLIDEDVDVVLELVGTGDEEDNYRSLVRDLGIANRVKFSGYVPREQIAGHYMRSDVFALPSFNEGMSVAALEAVAAGLPLIMTRTGGTSDLVEAGVNGFVFDWADISALTNLVRQLASNRSLALKMGEASRTKALELSWDATAESYLNLFHCAVKSDSNPELSDSVVSL
jgi:phosphatidylinositol alpha-1,6-mannosyltransferase